MSDATIEAFSHQTYTVRRKFLTFAGAKFHIYDPSDELVMFCKLKAFKLKEDIRLYTDEDMTTELLSIQARQIIDFSSAYDVVDAVSGEHVGALRRKGMKSMVKDEWIILDSAGSEVGLIQEDSAMKALARRFVEFAAMLLPQAYHMTYGGQPVGSMKQNFNPFVLKINIDFTQDQQMLLDRRLGMAAAILMCAVEGRQS